MGIISQDPIGFAAGDANLYRYVGNGPTNATDPSGLEEVPIPEFQSDETQLLSASFRIGGIVLLNRYQNPELFRGLQPHDVASFQAGNGLSPVVGSNPRAAVSQAEMTYRHLRPGGNARIAGSNRISWTTVPEMAEVLAGKNQTNQVLALDPVMAKQNGVRIMSPKELLSDLEKYRSQLQSEIDSGTLGKGRLQRVNASLKAVSDAKGYVQTYGERHTVGPIPDEALLNAKQLKQIRSAQSAGRVLIGLSVFLSAKEVMDASPERRNAVLIDEVAAFSADMIMPMTGEAARYATQTSRGELRILSRMFPTAYTWAIDAYFGEAIEASDPEGVKYFNWSMRSWDRQLQMFSRMFRGY
ncbi:hypothetical protein NHH03_15920 [Stieleria sp. TO1_6]|uniref:hypothetical protein n=1 Tax=Stieleria tagensis TaxID=2956795 RepID=UPI00209B57DD|nr:hypothetical protein [Stieleria tagensis]MCO8123236.1 hypothetical protein [Stieleria tagensis]